MNTNPRHEPDANDPGPTEREFASMRLLADGEPIRKFDWISDINEWSDSDMNGAVGEEFHYVWRFL